MTTNTQIKAWILNKLRNHRYIGGKHTDIKNIRKGTPPKFHFKIDKLMLELIKDGFITLSIKPYGKHISLNPYFSKKTNEFIQKYYTKIIFK